MDQKAKYEPTKTKKVDFWPTLFRESEVTDLKDHATPPPLADQIRKVAFDGLLLQFPGILRSHLKTQSTQLPFCCWRRQE